MRNVVMTVCAMLVFASLSFAQCSGSACGAADKKAGGCCGTAKASYSDARTAPACAPQQVQDFHKVLVYFMEAHSNRETSYIRDYAQHLYDAARTVTSSKPCCPEFNKKAFKSSSKELVKACDALRKTAADKKSPDNDLIAEMQTIEERFTAVSNSCQ
jgi:hypothetical protein